jgi:hypothetical protein
MNDSAREGLEVLSERGEARGAARVLDGARGAVARRRSRARATLVVTVLLVVGVAAGLVATRDDGGNQGGREIATQPSVEVEGSPPPDEGDITLWLSDTVLPSTGADVMAVLRNTGTEPAVFGVATGLDRWNGTSWQEQLVFGTCVGGWHCFGETVPAQGWEAIGLGAPSAGLGGAEWIRVTPLEPGWYRFRKVANEGVTATGTFRVVDEAVRTVDFSDRTRAIIDVSPVATTGTGTVTLSTSAEPRQGVLTAADIEAFEATLGSQLLLDRWDGETWVRVQELVTPDPEPGSLGAVTIVVTIPSDGVYRVTRAQADGSLIHGYFPAVKMTSAINAPPPDAGPVKLHLSDIVIPPSGADVMVVVQNDGTDPVTHGMGADIERWDGADWAVVHEQGAVYPVGRSALPGSVGPSERFTIPALEPGWYRLRKDITDAGSATGTFLVTADAPPTVDLGSTAVDRLEITPPVVFIPRCVPQGGCGIRISVVLAETQDAAAIDVVETSLDDGARLDRWVDGTWVADSDLDFEIENRIDWQRDAGQRMAQLPQDLTPGAYRVVRTDPDGAELTGVFSVKH